PRAGLHRYRYRVRPAPQDVAFGTFAVGRIDDGCRASSATRRGGSHHARGTPGRERIRRHRRGRYDGHGLPGCGRAGRTATVSATITADDGVLVRAPGKINLR